MDVAFMALILFSVLKKMVNKILKNSMEVYTHVSI